MNWQQSAYHTWCQVLYWREPCIQSRTTSERVHTSYSSSTHAFY